MHDAFVMRRLQRERDLTRDLDRLVERHGAALETTRQRAALDELEDEKARGRQLLEAVDRADVRMIERGQHLGLALEACEAFGVVSNRCGQQLQRDVAPEPGIACAIDLAHAASAEQRDDLVRAEDSARHHGYL